MKFVKYFLQKRSVTILLLLLVLGGGLLSYVKMGKLEDAPFTIKQALVLTPYPGASPSEVQSQVTDVLEESIQSLGELYYLKTENRAGLSKITVYVKKEIRADEMQQLWDKLRRKVNDVQSKLPAGAGPSVVNDDFGDVAGLQTLNKLAYGNLVQVHALSRIDIAHQHKIMPIVAMRSLHTRHIHRMVHDHQHIVTAACIGAQLTHFALAQRVTQATMPHGCQCVCQSLL